ncbi:hypothetical protein GCM10009744_41700 [Kribbella alba]|uniref:Uncharacterized protein n=1 Tax=Kribbella alba TaxID=190197 RepID=A0ABN2FH61_9ACTN
MLHERLILLGCGEQYLPRGARPLDPRGGDADIGHIAPSAFLYIRQFVVWCGDIESGHCGDPNRATSDRRKPPPQEQYAKLNTAITAVRGFGVMGDVSSRP